MVAALVIRPPPVNQRVNQAAQSKKKAAQRAAHLLDSKSRDERIRTSDPLIPNQVLYQAEPRPDMNANLF